MPSPEDRLRTRFRQAVGDEPADAVFEELARRHGRRRLARRVGGVGLAALVIAVSVGGFVGLSRAFRSDAPALGSGPVPVSPSTVPTTGPSVGPTPSSFPGPGPIACHDRSVRADFDAVGGLDTATVACAAGRWSLDVTWSSGASGTWPLSCDLGCVPFAAPDLNGDGLAELLVWNGYAPRPGTGGFVQVYDMTPSEATGTALTPSQGSGSLFSDGRLAVGHMGDGSAALACSDKGMVWMEAMRQPSGGWLVHRWAIEVHTSAANGDRMLLVGDQTTSEQPNPVEQPTDLCGAGVLVDVDTGDRLPH